MSSTSLCATIINHLQGKTSVSSARLHGALSHNTVIRRYIVWLLGKRRKINYQKKTVIIVIIIAAVRN
jgi:hypothetical protein